MDPRTGSINGASEDEERRLMAPLVDGQWVFVMHD